jgi:hypothetical protein
MALCCCGVTGNTRPKFPQHAEIDSQIRTVMNRITLEFSPARFYAARVRYSVPLRGKRKGHS